MATNIPEIKAFRPIDFPKFNTLHLDNGIPVYQMISKDYDVLKLEINFKAGRMNEKQQGVARACADQLKEGSVKYNSEFLADKFDSYGASFQTTGGMDFSRVELYSLSRHFNTLMPYIQDILMNPSFSEKELNSYKHRNIQRLQLDLSKNDIIAYRAITEKLFGKDHPYGYNSTQETILALSPDLLIEHFENNYFKSIPGIIIAGGIDDKIIQVLNESIGSIKLSNKNNGVYPPSQIEKENKFLIKARQKYQSSIRIGRKLFDRMHPDYPGLYLLNTILGGFFGSRLMQNIREEKGLTYDIYSTIDMLWNDGYLMIGAEVDNENISIILEEIYSEFDHLKKELVSSEELQLVKNYINGNLLNLMNGPFNSIELMRLLAVYKYDMEFFNYFMNQILVIDSEKLRELAKKYLNPEQFIEVIVAN